MVQVQVREHKGAEDSAPFFVYPADRDIIDKNGYPTSRFCQEWFKTKEEIPFESEGLQLSLTPKDLGQTSLQHNQQKFRTYPSQAYETIQP